jgi:hypothetical protein
MRSASHLQVSRKERVYLTMNPSEQKRQEKLQKRFKPVLDEKQKLKARFKSLESFLGTKDS